MARRKKPVIADELLDQLLAGDGWCNSRHGYGKKTLLTDKGTLDISPSRDHLAMFDPPLIAKYRRRVSGFDERMVSLVGCEGSQAPKTYFPQDCGLNLFGSIPRRLRRGRRSVE